MTTLGNSFWDANASHHRQPNPQNTSSTSYRALYLGLKTPELINFRELFTEIRLIDNGICDDF